MSRLTILTDEEQDDVIKRLKNQPVRSACASSVIGQVELERIIIFRFALYHQILDNLKRGVYEKVLIDLY